MTVRLHRIGPADDALEIAIERFPFVIGRRTESDCALPLACISRRHCRFTQEGEQVLVQDLESHNGTFVNGRRALVPLPVQHGDELGLGPMVFRVLLSAKVQETRAGWNATRDDGSSLACEDARLSSGRDSH